MIYLSYHEAAYFGPSDTYDYAWEKFIVSVVSVFSLIFGAIEPRGAIFRPLLMIFPHYFSGFALLENWGQFPPFELIYMVILAGPGAFAGYIGTLLARP